MTRKEYMKAYSKKYREANKAKAREYATKYYEDNKEDLLGKSNNWYKDNKEAKLIYDRKYRTARLKNDINYKLANYLRRRIGKIIRSNKKAGSAVKDLGCTLGELKKHLEDKFEQGMTWDNHSNKGWHIDHKKPLSKFDLTDRKQFLEACNYNNLQPLWANDNLTKSNKY